MKNIIKLIIIISIIIFSAEKTKAQTDSIISACEKMMPSPYVSDGQQYMALINQNESAEFDILFYGGSTYRIVACNGTQNSLKFTMYDKDRNILFTSSDYKNTPFWDFKFENTIHCYIEAKLISETQKSGFAILLIGFKK